MGSLSDNPYLVSSSTWDTQASDTTVCSIPSRALSWFQSQSQNLKRVYACTLLGNMGTQYLCRCFESASPEPSDRRDRTRDHRGAVWAGSHPG